MKELTTNNQMMIIHKCKNMKNDKTKILEVTITFKVEPECMLHHGQTSMDDANAN